MRRLTIFGKSVYVVEERSGYKPVDFKDNRIVVQRYEGSSGLIKDFLSDLLYSKLCSIYEGIRIMGGVELFGNLDFEVVEKIDRKRERVAKFKGNKVVVKLSAVVLPGDALKYIIAHELAHISTKRHTGKFWKVVETIYPDYKIGEEVFSKEKQLLKSWSGQKDYLSQFE
jgi:hypothetical protein